VLPKKFKYLKAFIALYVNNKNSIVGVSSNVFKNEILMHY